MRTTIERLSFPFFPSPSLSFMPFSLSFSFSLPLILAPHNHDHDHKQQNPPQKPAVSPRTSAIALPFCLPLPSAFLSGSGPAISGTRWGRPRTKPVITRHRSSSSPLLPLVLAPPSFRPLINATQPRKASVRCCFSRLCFLRWPFRWRPGRDRDREERRGACAGTWRCTKGVCRRGGAQRK